MLPTQSMQGMKHNLPTCGSPTRAKIRVPMQYPTGRKVMYSVHDVPTTQLPTEASYLQEPNPPNFEERVNHFMNMYQRGETIPPILFYKNPDGTVKILDGRARLEAFRRLQVSHIPAVENFSISQIGKTLAIAGRATKTGFGNFMSAAKGENKPLIGDKSDIRTHKVTSTSIGTNLGKVVHVADEGRKEVSSGLAKAGSLSREIGHYARGMRSQRERSRVRGLRKSVHRKLRGSTKLQHRTFRNVMQNRE